MSRLHRLTPTEWRAVQQENLDRHQRDGTVHFVEVLTLEDLLRKRGVEFDVPFHSVLKWASLIETGVREPVRYVNIAQTQKAQADALRLLDALDSFDDESRRNLCPTGILYSGKTGDPKSEPWLREDWLKFLKFAARCFDVGIADTSFSPCHSPFSWCHAMAFEGRGSEPEIILPTSGPGIIQFKDQHYCIQAVFQSGRFNRVRHVAERQYESAFLIIQRAWRGYAPDKTPDRDALRRFLETPVENRWEAAYDFVRFTFQEEFDTEVVNKSSLQRPITNRGSIPAQGNSITSADTPARSLQAPSIVGIEKPGKSLFDRFDYVEAPPSIKCDERIILASEKVVKIILGMVKARGSPRTFKQLSGDTKRNNQTNTIRACRRALRPFSLGVEAMGRDGYIIIDLPN